MIISASYRTDIPAFYGAWFMNRLGAGYCRTVNPYGGQVVEVPLTPADVDGFVFWTRNAGPFLDALDEVRGRGFPFVLHQTITGYPRALDFATVEARRAANQLRRINRDFGARVPVWRYDPVVISSFTPPAWHRANFATLAAALSGVVDEVVVSFCQVYRKTARNMAAAARAFRFAWRDPPDDEKRALLSDLSAIATDHGMAVTICGQPALLVDGAREASCIDARRLADVAGSPIAARAKPHRETCACWSSRDIGEYDTCPHGCVYCYAVRNRSRAKRRFNDHDPAGEFLFAPPPRAGARRPGD